MIPNPLQPETKQIHLAMAKASTQDIEYAIKLNQFLESIEDGLLPNETPEGEISIDEDELQFNEDNYEHLKRFHSSVMGMYQCGGLFRIIGGYMVVADPKNEILKPDSDIIEHHPKLVRALKITQHIDSLVPIITKVFNLNEQQETS